MEINQNLRRKLIRIADLLRWRSGVKNPTAIVEQICYLVYLKLLDEEESRTQPSGKTNNGDKNSLFPKQSARYRWSEWRSKSGKELYKFVRDEVFLYVASLVKEAPQVAEYFRDATLEIDNPEVFEQVLGEIDEINFNELGPAVTGDAFAYLMTHLVESWPNRNFGTPRQIRAMMVEMVDPDIGDMICDPSMRHGWFLS